MPSLSEVKSFTHRINPTEEIEGRGSFGYYIVRPISLYLTWLLLQTPLRANQVTVLHMLLGMAGAILLGHPDIGVRLAGCGLLYAGFVLDNVDGEIARFRKEVSITGKYIDTIAHTFVNPFMFFFFGLGAYWDTGNIVFVILGFFAAIFCLRLDTFAMYAEAAKAFMSNLDRNYDYYANIEKRAGKRGRENLEYVSKRADSMLKRLAFAVFAYPGSLHIMLGGLLISGVGQMLDNKITGWYIPATIISVYGVLLPIRRMMTIRRIATQNETEAQLVDLESKLK